MIPANLSTACTYDDDLRPYQSTRQKIPNPRADSRFAPSQWETALLVTTSLIGWMQAYNQPWNPIARWRAHTWMSLQTWRYFKNFCVASSWGNLKSNNEPQYRLWCAYWIRCDIHGEFRKQGDTYVQRAAQLVSQIWSCKNSFALIFILNDPIKSYTALLSWPDQNYNPIGSLFFKQ